MNAMVRSGVAVWDFWYVNLDNRAFLVFFLFADRDKFASGSHHWHAGIGFRRCEISHSALYKCIDKINQGDFELALVPPVRGYRGSSYWTGSVLAYTNGLYELYFTHRNSSGDPTNQIVRVATSRFPSQGNWNVKADWKCEADGEIYARSAVEGDPTIQAWRDPFVYRIGDEYHMLVCAKARSALDVRYSGCVGHVIKAAEDHQWKHVSPMVPPGSFGECECPHAKIRDGRVGAIFFSCQSKFLAPNVLSEYGAGGLFELDLRTGTYRLLVDEDETGAYACRFVDELSVFVGFKKDSGVLAVIEN